jgi:hypothetical protein
MRPAAAPPRWRRAPVGETNTLLPRTRAAPHWQQRQRPLRAAAAADGDAAHAADSDAHAAHDRRRVAYNRMRHERDRANRRARVAVELAELSPEELQQRRERGRREAEAQRARIAAAAAPSASDPPPLTIVVDCGFPPDGRLAVMEEDGRSSSSSSSSSSSTSRAVRSLAKQLELSAALNRRALRPARLHAVSFAGPVAAFAASIGAERWPLFEAHREPLLEVFPRDKIVVLSPDAVEPLAWSCSSPSCNDDDAAAAANAGGDEGGGGGGGASEAAAGAATSAPPRPPALLDRSRVYVLGGIVDRTVVKGVTLSFAQLHGLQARRLPVAEHSAQLGRLSEPGASKTPILNVSDVVGCLLELDGGAAAERGGDWAEALRRALPARKLVAGVAGAAGGRRSRRQAKRREQQQQQLGAGQEARD